MNRTANNQSAEKAIDLLQRARDIVQKFERPRNTYALYSIQSAIDSLIRHNTNLDHPPTGTL